MQLTLVVTKCDLSQSGKLGENKRKEADMPVEQDAAGSSNDHVNQEDNVANELPQGLDEGEEFEQAIMWQGLDESD